MDITRTALKRAAVAAMLAVFARNLDAQSRLDAKARWERLCTIRREKFDRVLPEAMRENGIDMWIVAMKEGHYDPLWELLGRGYVGSIGCPLDQPGVWVVVMDDYGFDEER